MTKSLASYLKIRHHFRCVSFVIATLFCLSGITGIAQVKTDTTVVRDSSLVIHIHSSDTVILISDTTRSKGLLSDIQKTETKKEEETINPKSVLETISFTKVLFSILFLVVAYFIIKMVTKLLNLFAERSTRYRITIKGIIPVFRILGWVLVIYLVIQGIISPPIETVIAVTASVGIAVGFAAQDILKNIFGGLMILFDRPFKVGDKIEVGKYYGEVVEIGLRSTRVITPDDSLVSVPNAEIMNQSVSNANSGEANCQVVAEIYLPLTVDTDRVRTIALETAQVSRYIYLNKPVVVLFFNEVKERRSYLKMRLKAYVADIRDEFAFKSDMTEIVIRELLQQKLIKAQDLY
ncbi:MAG: mechanosensitive ion channel family protein [Cyclobacteriaceae bacterium]